MEYNEDIQKTAEIIRMIFPMLARLEIPANPVNFAIWYEYFLGRSDELNTVLNEIINNTNPYDENIAKDLFLRYIVSPGASKMEKVSDDLKQLMSEAVATISEAGNDFGNYGNLLRNFDDQVKRGDTVSQIQLVVKSLLTETNSIMESNRRFKKKLQMTEKEVGVLKQKVLEIRKHAKLDPLTELANRKTFDNALKEAIETAIHKEQNLCLMMLDIDHFKSINDEHGHLVGDNVIKHIASTLKQMVKGKDLAARYGGEEFSIILEDTPMSGALSLGESIREKIESDKLKRKDTNQRIGTVTISIGISSIQAGDDNNSLIDRADMALYHSKKMGRNRVTKFGDFKVCD